MATRIQLLIDSAAVALIKLTIAVGVVVFVTGSIIAYLLEGDE